MRAAKLNLNISKDKMLQFLTRSSS